MLINLMPAGVARSQSGSGQATGPTNPPPPKVIASGSSLQKLAPDLREIVQNTPENASGLVLDGVSGDPLLVSALVNPTVDVDRFFTRSVRSREVAGMQWVTGEIQPAQLSKLASVEQVLGVISTNTYQTSDAPDLDNLRSKFPHLSVQDWRALMAQGGPQLVMQHIQEQKVMASVSAAGTTPPVASEQAAAVQYNLTGSAASILNIHDVPAAVETGYTGEGVTVAVVDTGVDFSHPDLQGTQARIASGPYQGWPFAYDTRSAALYAMNPLATVGPDTGWGLLGLSQYVHTLPVPREGLNCSGPICNATLALAIGSSSQVKINFSWPNTSRSGNYYYSIHPDDLLSMSFYYMGRSYPENWLMQPPLIAADEAQAGVYDTVYADINFNHFIGDVGEKMTREQPISGADLNQDGIADVSGGMLGWISDGLHQPPGVETVYPSTSKYTPPAAGRLLVFINDQDGHGTNCASQIAGQGRVTDPKGIGPSNPYYAGSGQRGGVGGAVIPSMAPDAQIVAIENGFALPFDAWTIAVLGFDGQANSGDEVQIVSNSWGDSEVINDGWDPTSRFAQNIAYQVASNITFLVATGNGGHGYGTVTAPGGGSIIDVGASTAYGNLTSFEFVKPEQFVYGEVQPWSDRGPGALGDPAPDVVAVGAYGTGANPLNIYYGNGQRAYDVFGGTSMATPVAAGNLALVYQAYYQKNHVWPTWSEARTLLLGTAEDLGYDVLVQGAGNIQAGRATAAADGTAPFVSPVQWQAGGYRGIKYPAFPAVLHAGAGDQQTFTITNPTQQPLTAELSDQVLELVGEETFSFAFEPDAPSSTYNLPVFLKDISSLIPRYNPDLVRAQVILPYSTFDVDNNNTVNNSWSVAFYDWFDRDSDGSLWTDTNQDGMVEEDEIGVDPATHLYEFNRFTYGDPVASYLEASLGKQGLSQRHEGVFLGLLCNFCGHSTNFQVRLAFYQHKDWDWLELPSSTVEVGAENSTTFTAELNVPDGTKPGAYEGAVAVSLDGHASILPVMVNVAVDSSTFRFGGPESSLNPLDNGRMFGGYNWDWRYESGDWRFFYFDLPEDSGGPGKTMVIDTRWNDPKTDLDTWVFSGAPNSDLKLPQAYFGPTTLQMTGGSVDTNIQGGEFIWNTQTRSSRELIGAPVQDGLGMIALHQVLAGGSLLADGFTGQAYQISSQPGEVNIFSQPESLARPILSGSQQIELTSSMDLEEGLTVQAFGMSATTELTNQQVRQSTGNNLCSGTWVYKQATGGLRVNHGGVIDLSISSGDVLLSPNLDLDLYLYEDDGDKLFTCGKERQIASARGASPDERIKVYFPSDGIYWAVVRGTTVPKKQASFNFRVRAVQGSGITLQNIPLGPIRANQPFDLTATFRTQYNETTATTLEGVVLIGPPAEPYLVEIPIHVQPTFLLSPRPTLTADSNWIRQQPVPVQLTFQNLGGQSENVLAQVTLPPGMVYQSNSAVGPNAFSFNDLSVDQASRTLNWQGPLAASQKVTLTFSVYAAPGFPPGPANISALVKATDLNQEWQVTTQVQLNTSTLLLPFIGR